MRTSEKLILLQSAFSPYRLPNLAASYSLSGAASDNTYLLNAGNVQLIADQSINSRVNGLVLNGASGNYASAPDSAALSITGDIDIRVFVAMNSWTPSVYHVFAGKFLAAGNQRSYQFGVVNTTGRLELQTTSDGGAGTGQVQTSTAATGFAAFSSSWIRVTRSASSGTATFYTSTDGITWVQLGATVSSTPSAIFDSTCSLLIGANSDLTAFSTCQVFRTQIYNGIAGTLAFDANFTTQAKLATSFTESSANAATVTINTSGDLGARISGARDLVQLTAAKQPAFSVVSGYNIGTFNGTNQYMQSAPGSWDFTSASAYWVGQLLALGGANDAVMFNVGTGALDALYLAGATAAQGNTRLHWAAYDGSTRGIYNNAATAGMSSTAAKVVRCGVAQNLNWSIRNNLSAAVSDTASARGSQVNGALAIGAVVGGGRYANENFSSLLLRSVADSSALQLQIAGVLIKKWGISLP